MKKLVLTFALSVLSAAAASAQGVYIEQRGGMAGGFEGGWDGDRGRHRGWDRGMRRGWDRDEERVVVRRSYREPSVTGSLGCRNITIRKQDDWGNTVTKRIQKCD